jgi:hypothetical protein
VGAKCSGSVDRLSLKPRLLLLLFKYCWQDVVTDSSTGLDQQVPNEQQSVQNSYKKRLQYTSSRYLPLFCQPCRPALARSLFEQKSTPAVDTHTLLLAHLAYLGSPYRRLKRLNASF